MVFDSVFFSFKLIAKYGSLNQKRKGEKMETVEWKKAERIFGYSVKLGQLAMEWMTNCFYVYFFGFFQYSNFEKDERWREGKNRGERIKNWQINLSCFYTKVESKPPSPSLLTANGNEKPQLSSGERKKRSYILSSVLFMLHIL